MVLLDDHTLLVTLGDMSRHGAEKGAKLAQDPLASYGKTVRLDLATGASEIYSLGHRNPQGLYRAPDGTIWSTEHGPRGGDELNRILQGANYGWPWVTYGTDYKRKYWPYSHDQGQHDGYQEPVHAWVPSVGISNLIGVEADHFALWRGDLLIASLKATTIFRTRIREGRAAYVEPISIGHRIRDIVEMDDGRILLWADPDIISIERAEAEVVGSGRRAFKQHCGGCHERKDGTIHGVGPDLRGIMGRNAASAPGFAYSPALKNSNFRWTPEALDRFIATPQRVVPGTSMSASDLSSAELRAAIIHYLE
ncbi:MAG: PQQ-dependent sugar dehydrogenase [Deltaproteobacteria bacterium]|nr:PQQ-dependent sugar dehydrogenase [Deltaproteobacteria bacterium]